MNWFSHLYGREEMGQKIKNKEKDIRVTREIDQKQRQRERFTLRKWLMLLWRLGKSKI